MRAGVEAQTLANVYHALDAGHEIVPVLNKIDLPAAEPDQVKRQIEDVIGIDASDAVMISAKTGLGIDEVLEAIVHRLPAPKGDRDASLKACWSTAGTMSISRGGAGPHRRWRDEKGPAHPDDGHNAPMTSSGSVSSRRR